MYKPLKEFFKKKYLLVFLVTCVACVTMKNKNDFFETQVLGQQSPWSHERFDDAEDQFTFAIVSDLYGGGRPGIFDVAIAQINLLHPAFIMSVGDLIDGGTEDQDQIKAEWNVFDQKADRSKAPFFYTGGNHDLSNTTMRQVWKERYGPRYYHFTYKNALFLVLDSEDFTDERMQEIYKAKIIATDIKNGKRKGNAVTSAYFKMPERRTGHISDSQSAYFEKVIEENTDVKWTFLFMHKPVWMGKGAGNLDRIEEALNDRQYTLFNGHFHTYSHRTRHNRDYIMLSTTGGAQNDQSDKAFDHFVMVTMTDHGPSIANLRLDGVLDKYAEIPELDSTMCFQASKCKEE